MNQKDLYNNTPTYDFVRKKNLGLGHKIFIIDKVILKKLIS